MRGKIGFAVVSHSNRQHSGDRLVTDGISDGPPKVGFGNKKNQRYGIKLHRSGSTEAYSKKEMASE